MLFPWLVIISSPSWEFRTVVTPSASVHKLRHTDPCIFFGSCFAESVGGRLMSSAFDVLVNPSHGILYNVVSLSLAMQRTVSGEPYSAKDLIRHPSNNMWCSFEHHSRFSAADVTSAVDGMNRALERARAQLLRSRTIYITLGSSWVYTRHGQVVANCHRFPAKAFSKELLTVSRTEQHLEEMLELVWRHCPELEEVVLTVSPVRHWKDGPVGNSRSKATLVVAATELAERYGRVRYFPAYELLVDDLRDYRYYAEDMLHPSELAVSYIWSAFCESFIAEESMPLIRAAADVKRAAGHRPFAQGGRAVKAFASSQLSIIDEMEARFGTRVGEALAAERRQFRNLLESS